MSKYKVDYQQPLPNAGSYNQKLSQMSNNYMYETQRYTHPELPSKNQIKYKYDQMNNLASMSNINAPATVDRADYPISGKHSRYPILINCDSCNDLTMTDVEYEHGFASKAWCFLLLPIFCTGFCCLCLNSCKDVKHICSRCRRDAGTCKSQFL